VEDVMKKGTVKADKAECAKCEGTGISTGLGYNLDWAPVGDDCPECAGSGIKLSHTRRDSYAPLLAPRSPAKKSGAPMVCLREGSFVGFVQD
jgi:hypothetical protein